ncbi:hypothetical protein L0657_01470 [Dyadobacter sp. CY345]|uniref:hypothetical protein n=1 Tax=Dyadobacter sp. CY345 TaxID=2909335 RepID=UPI001F3C3A97|nr:hypothetical protein [Dyadobacter sp. CY345]MCF2442608.1 hypothetical protein [Dyadobacter sp. CY345]
MAEEIKELHEGINKLEEIILNGGFTIDDRLKKLEFDQKYFVKRRDLQGELDSQVIIKSKRIVAY